MTAAVVDDKYAAEREAGSMSSISKKPLTRWQKTHRALGFQKGYNLPLFIIFAGAMLGFCLARTAYLNINTFAAQGAPGEWYWYQSGHYRVGIIMHLATVIPAGILMWPQFVPIIRRKAILFHRINGYIVIILLVLGVASALMLTRRSFGGAAATQAGIGTLAILVIGSLGMAYYNIKKLQIDQHRAWMLRAVFYCGTIITLRLIMIIGAQILPMTGKYYSTFSCDELATLTSPGQFRKLYPQCFVQNGAADGYVAVYADFATSAAAVGADLDLNFSMGIWLAIVMHLIGVEIYLNLTPAESERLRMVAYEKQVKAGYKHPGSAGLTVNRWGDAPAWRPIEAKQDGGV